ncbi:DNA-binding protein [Xanthomonas oryzae]|uniref:DNA-binding protein n=1 Tax=Xanthomonas oryzae TaxID=347 RepID=A0AAP0ZLD3_9XANT|nr:helix-turn-helix transcriptional regulator [Xanthomonas oryzae]KOR45018.1 DNA-binding protein [Xanthomonas oryzae]QBG82942.1 XRE family transcriptional regulator [Xanthomonas oryzae]
MDLDDARLIFANRLRQARLAAGLTQEALGVAAGVSAEVARTRINRYEHGVNECDLRTAKRLAEALNMPLAALFAETDELADAIRALAKLSVEEQRKVVAELQLKASHSDPPSP